jgi:hypothetical protein
MYITNFYHLLDEQGNIPKDIPKRARELSNYLALIVDGVTSADADDCFTGVRCNVKNCPGDVLFSISDDMSEIHWYCTDCMNEKELNDIYQRILVQYQADPIFIRNLKTSQRIWITSRDAELKVKYPERPGYYGLFPPKRTG